MGTDTHAHEAQQLAYALDITGGPLIATEPYGVQSDLPGWQRTDDPRVYRGPSGATYSAHQHDPQRPMLVADHVRVIVAVDTFGGKVDICCIGGDPPR